jgi:hypothetical protein
MKRMSLGGIALLAVLASSALAPVTAAAESTKILPEPSKLAPIMFTGVGGEVTLATVGATKVTCKGETSSGEFTSSTSGPTTSLLTECKGPLGVACTGTGDEKGAITLTGTLHFWSALHSGKLVPVFADSINEASFKCSVTNVNLKGCVAGGAGPWEVSTGWTLTTLVGGGKEGVNEFTKVLPAEGGEEVGCSLEMSTGKGFEQTSEVVNEAITSLSQGGKETEIELMCSGCTKALRVVPTPRRKNFGKVTTGETREQTVSYENQGLGDWEPTGMVTKTRVIGVNGAFSFELGGIPCDKLVEEKDSCEIEYAFKPTNKERLIFIVGPDGLSSSLIFLEGTGV